MPHCLLQLTLTGVMAWAGAVGEAQEVGEPGDLATLSLGETTAADASETHDPFDDPFTEEDEPVPGEDDDPKLRLARRSFNWLRAQVLEQPDNWRAVHQEMSALGERHPSLRTPHRGKLLADLALTINSPPPRQGTTEALLLEWARTPDDLREFDLFAGADQWGGKKVDGNAPAREIILRGFASVPDLVALLDDRRVTAHELPYQMQRRAHIKRVGDLAEYLLYDMAGWPPRPYNEYRNRAAWWRRWWNRTKKQREEDFFAEAVFWRPHGRIEGANNEVAAILAERFPARLPEVCAEYDRHRSAGVYSDVLDRVIAQSDAKAEADRANVQHVLACAALVFFSFATVGLCRWIWAWRNLGRPL